MCQLFAKQALVTSLVRLAREEEAEKHEEKVNALAEQGDQQTTTARAAVAVEVHQ